MGKILLLFCALVLIGCANNRYDGYNSSTNTATSTQSIPSSTSNPGANTSYNPAENRQNKRSYGSTCPCSGYTNCVGSRGGTYCYTSGGKKRYRK